MIEIIPNWHPVFVHFTVALIPISALCYLTGYLFKHRNTGKELLLVARWCLWFGAIAAIATATAGSIAYYTVAHDAPSHVAMTTHRNWAIATLIVILIVAAWSGWSYLKKQPVSLVFILAMMVTTTLLATTAWHGAEVVYRHGIGVKSLPKVTGEGHQHAHSNDKKSLPDASKRERGHTGHRHAH